MPKPTSTSTAVAVDRIARALLDETSHRAEKIADAAELSAAESFAAAGLPLPRRKVLRVADTATEKSVTYYNDWATFARKVEQTDCSSQLADRGQDH